MGKNLKPKLVLAATVCFLLAVLAPVLFRKEPIVRAWKDPEQVGIEVKGVTIFVPSKEEFPGIFIKFPDMSVQYVPLTEKPRR